MATTTVFPQRQRVGQRRSARDVKSDTDSKSAAPALLCEASCSGLILTESMCGGLGLWHTSRDSEQLPRVPTQCCCCCCRRCQYASIWAEETKENKRDAIVNKILKSEACHHSWWWNENSWWLTGMLPTNSFHLHYPWSGPFYMKFLKTSHQPRCSPTSFALLSLNTHCMSTLLPSLLESLIQTQIWLFFFGSFFKWSHSPQVFADVMGY